MLLHDNMPDLLQQVFGSYGSVSDDALNPNDKKKKKKKRKKNKDTAVSSVSQEIEEEKPSNSTSG